MRDDSRCFLCGKSRQEVGTLILGEVGGICPDCVSLCLTILEQGPGEDQEQQPNREAA